MAPSQNSTASDAVLPASPLASDARERSDALDARDLEDDALDDPTQQLVDVFVTRPTDHKPASADDPDNPANNLQYPDDHPVGTNGDDEAGPELQEDVEENAEATQQEDPGESGNGGTDANTTTAIASATGASTIAAAEASASEPVAVNASGAGRGDIDTTANTISGGDTESGSAAAMRQAEEAPASMPVDSRSGDAAAGASSSGTNQGRPSRSHKEQQQAALQAKVAQAQQAAAASAAALAVAAASSGAATTTVPSMPLPGGLGHAGYAFPGLTGNGAAAALMGHPLVSVPMQAGRRAVRIAPMGVLPLPPQGGPHGGALMADLSGGASGFLGSMAAAAAAASAAVGADVGVTGSPGSAVNVVGEMRKGKRRGTGAGTALPEGISAEERTKQKRMLRNRESAARSRDKRKSRNIRLENSIQKHTMMREKVEVCFEELSAVVTDMQQVLKKHKLNLPG